MREILHSMKILIYSPVFATLLVLAVLSIPQVSLVIRNALVLNDTYVKFWVIALTIEFVFFTLINPLVAYLLYLRLKLVREVARKSEDIVDARAVRVLVIGESISIALLVAVPFILFTLVVMVAMGKISLSNPLTLFLIVFTNIFCLHSYIRFLIKLR